MKGRRSDTHKECNNKTRIRHELACLGIDSSPSRERSAQKSAKIGLDFQEPKINLGRSTSKSLHDIFHGLRSEYSPL